MTELQNLAQRYGMPAPKFGTLRDWNARTIGTLDEAFSRIWLRQSLMPAQRYIADVGGELLPNGLPRYRMVVVTEPRQAGKSHLDMAQTGQRCFSSPQFRAWYTAQTGSDARDQFLKFHDDVVTDTPLGKVVRTLRGNGHEVMKFPNGSTFRPHPPTEKSLHGKQSDRNSVDEAWAFSEDEGARLLAAISPTQLTRPGAQLWIWSAGGTPDSTWLASLIARGRAGDPSICYVEFGIPDDMSPDDIEGIAAHHPAYGHTLTLDSLTNLRTQLDDDSAWLRAAGNRWTDVIGGAISPAEFAAASENVPEVTEESRKGFGAARAYDGSQVAIACAAQVGDQIVVEVCEVLPTAYMAAERVLAFAGRDLISLDPSGPSAPLASQLAILKAPNVRLMGSRDVAAATANVLDGLKVRAHLYRPHPALSAAVTGAAKRKLGDGGYGWARTNSAVPIVALEACTNALDALVHAPPATGPAWFR